MSEVPLYQRQLSPRVSLRADCDPLWNDVGKYIHARQLKDGGGNPYPLCENNWDGTPNR